jgi:hypothetical protein
VSKRFCGVLSFVNYLSDVEIECMLDEVRNTHENVSTFIMSVAQARSLLEEIRGARVEKKEQRRRRSGPPSHLGSIDVYGLHMAVWDGEDR